MSGRSSGRKSDDAVRREAADWFARLRAPDGEKDRAAFEQWRSADSVHAAAFEQLNRRWEQTAFLANTKLGRSRRTRQMPPETDGQWFSRRMGAAAAIVLLLLGTGLSWLNGWNAHPEATPPREASFATAVGQQKAVALPDGSTVMLDTDSFLEVAYTSEVRALKLGRGRARFRVAHETERPLQVMAGSARVVALGTVFDVQIAQDQRVQVSLLQGSVQVVSTQQVGASGFSRAGSRLTPGQQVSVDPDRRTQELKPYAPSQINWPSGMLSFDGTRLGDAVEQMNRYNRRKVNLADPRLAELRVTGTFRAKDVDEFAEAIVEAFSLRIVRGEDGSISVQRPASQP
jgi:transmembrane sensor